jgi:uncharacterized membrane protein YbjE (DUF340 family)
MNGQGVLSGHQINKSPRVTFYTGKEYSQVTMATTSKQEMTTVLWAFAWGLVFIASAFLFKGNPAKDWIQSLLFVVGVTIWLWQSRRVARPLC